MYEQARRPLHRQARLARLGRQLRLLALDGRAHRQPLGLFTPNRGSITETELTNWQDAFPKLDRRMLSEAYTAGIKLIVASEDRLVAAARLAHRRSSGLSALTLLRAAVESASFAFWLLDPSLQSDQRAARAAGNTQASVGSLQGLNRKLRVQIDPGLKDQLSTLEDLIQAFKDVGVFQQRPAWEKLVVTLANELKIAPALSRSGLDALVNAAHSGKVILDATIFFDDEEDVETGIHPITEWTLWFAAHLYAAVMLRAAQTMEWNPERWSRKAFRRTRRIQRLFNRAKADFALVD